MVDKETARTVVGIIGNVVSFFLFISPVPTFKQIIVTGTVAAFKPDPYLATVLNCSLWVIYGLPFVHPDSTLVISINAIGLFIEFLYVVIFFIFADWTKRKRISIAMACIIVFVAAMAAITLAAFHGYHDRSMFIGIVCVVFNVVMYAAPLTVMQRVIRTRSVKYMPFFLSLANLINAIIWIIYALLKIDAYIIIPNALGAVSGLVQIILFILFYKSTPKEEEQRDPARLEIQLPEA